MPDEIELLPLQFEDIEEIPRIQPPEWGDVRLVFRSHFSRPYFLPIKAMLDRTIVGIGQVILTDQSAWLGNIIVRKEFQRRGIGRRITRALTDLAFSRNRERLFLIATAAGRSLYHQLGFKDTATFQFFDKPVKMSATANTSRIRPITDRDRPQLYELDERAFGEDRSPILKHFLPNGFVYQSPNRKISGFYLPDLGEGLIIATDGESGNALFQKRAREKIVKVVVPEANRTFCRHLSDRGYRVFRTGFMMNLGPDKNWQPEMIYSRIGGYLG